MSNSTMSHWGDPGLSSGDEAWVLVASAMVMLMTPALALFYGGLVSDSVVVSTILSCIETIGVVSFSWALIGYSLVYGDESGGPGVLGSAVDALLQLPDQPYLPPGNTTPTRISQHLFALYQLTFAVITAAIISGATVQRMVFWWFLVFAVAFHLLIYCPIAHYVFSPQGFLARYGVVDYAGGLVVHTASGVSSLVIGILMSRTEGARPTAAVPHNVPHVLLGASLLLFGWFGFTPGSALSAGFSAGRAALNTQLGASSAMLTWTILEVVTNNGKGRPKRTPAGSLKDKDGGSSGSEGPSGGSKKSWRARGLRSRSKGGKGVGTEASSGPRTQRRNPHAITLADVFICCYRQRSRRASTGSNEGGEGGFCGPVNCAGGGVVLASRPGEALPLASLGRAPETSFIHQVTTGGEAAGDEINRGASFRKWLMGRGGGGEEGTGEGAQGGYGHSGGHSKPQGFAAVGPYLLQCLKSLKLLTPATDHHHPASASSSSSSAPGRVEAFVQHWFPGRPTAVGAACGLVTGLVAITPSGAWITPMWSIFIGAVTTIAVYGLPHVMPTVSRDDRLDCFAIHGIGGLVGTLMTGLFATHEAEPSGPQGAFFGEPFQIIRQLVGVLVTVAISGLGTCIIYSAMCIASRWTGLPLLIPTPHQEAIDTKYHGERAYYYLSASNDTPGLADVLGGGGGSSSSVMSMGSPLAAALSPPAAMPPSLLGLHPPSSAAGVRGPAFFDDPLIDISPPESARSLGTFGDAYSHAQASGGEAGTSLDGRQSPSAGIGALVPSNSRVGAAGSSAAGSSATGGPVTPAVDLLFRELEELQSRNAAARQFLRWTFHEVRVPLNTLQLGIGEVACEVNDCPQCAVKPRLNEAVSFINLATSQMQRIMDSVLTMEKIESGKFALDLAPMSMHKLVQLACIEMQRRAEAERVSLAMVINTPATASWSYGGGKTGRIGAAPAASVAAPPPFVLGDYHRLLQVLLNFLSNAIKFVPHDGSGKVSVMMTITDEWEATADGSRVEQARPALAAPPAPAQQTPHQQTQAAPPTPSGRGKDKSSRPNLARWLLSRRTRDKAGPDGHSQPPPPPPLSGASEEDASTDDTAEGSDTPTAGGRYTAPLRSLSSSIASVEGGEGSSSVASNRAHAVARWDADEPALATGRHVTWAFSSESPVATVGMPLPPEAAAGDEGEPLHVRRTPSFLPFRPAANTAYTVGLDTASHGVDTRVVLVRISVIDNGVGMTQAQLEKLFIPFEQFHAGKLQGGGGSGLGLCIAREITLRHGGDVEVESIVGQGTAFTVIIPFRVIESRPCSNAGGPAAAAAARGKQPSPETAASAAPSPPLPSQRVPPAVPPLDVSRVGAAAAAAPEAPATASSTSTASSDVPAPASPHVAIPVPVSAVAPTPPPPRPALLIIDDTHTNRVFLARALARALPGVEILAAENGAEGMRAVEERRRAVESAATPAVGPIQVVLTDKDMPVMDGHQVASALRAGGFTGLLIGITGNALLEDRQEFIGAGADDVLPKPVHLPTLLGMLRDKGGLQLAPGH